MAKKPKTPKTVEALKHDEATRNNIPTAEYQSLMQKEDSVPARVSYPRGGNGLDDEKAQRNRDLDPQLVRSEEHTSELQTLMRSSYAVFCLKNKHLSTNTNASDIYKQQET